MKVYQTFRNNDMTEGRGPMVTDKCFLHRADAEAYINSKPGIMGRRAKWSEETLGDWHINEIQVYENPQIDVETIRRENYMRAREKLSLTEYDALRDTILQDKDNSTLM